jgi:hypothetical protein
MSAFKGPNEWKWFWCLIRGHRHNISRDGRDYCSRCGDDMTEEVREFDRGFNEFVLGVYRLSRERQKEEALTKAEE